MAEPPQTPQTIAQHLNTLAKNLDRHMRRRGLTEDSLAEASGMSPRTVGNFLRPNNRASKRGTSKSFPSGTLANLIKLAEALGLEPWELLRKRDSERERFLAAVEQLYIDHVMRRAELDELAAAKAHPQRPPTRTQAQARRTAR